MQQREYLEVRLGGHFDGDDHTTQELWGNSEGRGGRFKRRKVTFTAAKLVGMFRQSEKSVSANVRLSGLGELLNQFGAEGWELVNVLSVERYPYADGFLLKRPKA